MTWLYIPSKSVPGLECCPKDCELGSSTWAKWGLDAAGLQDIPPAIDLHEQLLELSTPLQMQKAMGETIRRMNAGHGLEIAA